MAGFPIVVQLTLADTAPHFGELGFEDGGWRRRVWPVS
jgi:hypothetical protein